MSMRNGNGCNKILSVGSLSKSIEVYFQWEVYIYKHLLLNLNVCFCRCAKHVVDR